MLVVVTFKKFKKFKKFLNFLKFIYKNCIASSHTKISYRYYYKISMLFQKSFYLRKNLFYISKNCISRHIIKKINILFIIYFFVITQVYAYRLNL